MKIFVVCFIISMLWLFPACSENQYEFDQSNLEWKTEIKAIAHLNSSLQNSDSENWPFYKRVVNGNQTVYELLIKNDVKNVTDVLNWKQVFFVPDIELNPGHNYFLQNDLQFETYSYYGGAWEGINKMHSTRGQIEIQSISDSTIDIKFIGSLEAEILDSNSATTQLILSDTLLRFKIN